MTFFNCENRHNCTGVAVIVSLIIGIIAAFLQVTAVITLTPIFSIVAFGIAILFLAVTLIATSLAQRISSCNNNCMPLSALLLGIIGTILSAAILLAVDFAATSILGAIIVGALFFFFSLLITSVACFASHLINCNK